MDPDILIVREGDAYRLLHGQLHLVSELSRSNEVLVEVRDEGEVRIVKSGARYYAGKDNQRFPLLRN
jgi:hypothetical protein